MSANKRPPQVIISLTKRQALALRPLFDETWARFRAGQPGVLLSQPLEVLTFEDVRHEMKVGMFNHAEGKKIQALLKRIMAQRKAMEDCS